MSKHTAGTWFFDDSEEDGDYVVTIFGGKKSKEPIGSFHDEHVSKAEARANAALAISAPALLAMCEETLAGLPRDVHLPIGLTVRMRELVSRAKDSK